MCVVRIQSFTDLLFFNPKCAQVVKQTNCLLIFLDFRVNRNLKMTSTQFVQTSTTTNNSPTHMCLKLIGLPV